MSVIIPAYNEEQRLPLMLEEAITYCDSEYGRLSTQTLRESTNGSTTSTTSHANARSRSTKTSTHGNKGYEILIVDDGSKDKTVDVALAIAQKHQLHDIIRVISLRQNRGKGGAVTHGFRHVRGEFVIFADADGASTFTDLGKLVAGCEEINDAAGRGVAVGSRAHMVGSEAVIKVGDVLTRHFPPPLSPHLETFRYSNKWINPQRSALRNTLMHAFHLLLRLLTPPATSSIRDTQCGFKLFSRASLPHIIPYMHAEGWIFDVEMLMLAESAPYLAMDDDQLGEKKKGPGIRVAEVPIGWKEVGGSKLNVMWDSLGMAYGLAILRLCWALGVYKRR